MLYNFRFIFLLIFSVNLFADIGDRFTTQKITADKKINKYVDYYILNQEKQKIKYLSERLKWSLMGSKNDNLDDINILTVRNSNLVDLVSNNLDGERSLSDRQIRLLHVIDQITLESLNDEGDLRDFILCKDIVNEDLAKSSDFIANDLEGDFLEDECRELGEKFTEFYQLGPYSIGNLNGTIFNDYRNRVQFDNWNEHPVLSKQIIERTKNLYQLREDISLLQDVELLGLSNELSTLRGFVQKRMIANAIIQRVNWLMSDLPNNCPGCNQISLNQALTNAQEYNLTTEYSVGEQSININDINLTAILTERIAKLNLEISEHESKIATATNDRVGKSVSLNTCINGCDSLHGIGTPLYGMCFINQCQGYQDEFDELTKEINDNTKSRAEKIAQRDDYQAILDNPNSISDNFSVNLTSIVTDRIAENISYNILQKINTIQKTIERFILQNGRLPRPDEIGDGLLPRMFDNRNNRITINIIIADPLNNNTGYRVVYSGIFSNTMINDLTGFNNRVVSSFRENVAFPLNGYVEQGLSQYDVVIPLSRQVSDFLDEVAQVAQMNANGFDVLLNLRAEHSCTSSNDKEVLYEPNGVGGFNLFQCLQISTVPSNNEWVSLYNSADEIQNDPNLNVHYRDNNRSLSIFSTVSFNGEFAGEYTHQDFNNTTVDKGLTVNGMFLRIR